MTFPRKKFFDGNTYFEADFDELQNNIGNYYDALIATLLGQIEAIEGDYLTSAHITPNAHHTPPTMDNIAQGSSFKKITTAEKAQFDYAFIAYLVSGSSLTFGTNLDIANYYFSKDADPDGGNIHANDILSRGNPVYSVVFDSGWHNIAAASNKGNAAHSLGYRPDFALLQSCNTDPTGQPEEYITTDGYVGNPAAGSNNSYGAFNDTYYNIFNTSAAAGWFRLLLFSYFGP